MPTHTRRLPRYGQLTITDTTDPERGEVAYHFTAPHAAGAVLIVPCHIAGTERAKPDGVRVQLGTGDRWSTKYRDELPVVYGVPLSSGVVFDPLVFLTADQPYLRFHRPTSPTTSTPAPPATSNYMLTILIEIIILWCSRPDVDALALTVARREAPARLADLRHGPLPARRRELAAAAAELARLEQLETELQALTDDREISSA